MPGTAYRRHALVSSLASVGIFSLGLVTGPILARALGPGGRGDVAAIMAPATVLSLVLALGLPTAAGYYVDTVPEGRLLATATVFGIAVGAPVCAVLWFLAPGYLSGHSPVTLSWARIFLIFLPLSVGMSAALEVRRRTSPGLSWNLWRGAPLLLPAVGTVLLALFGRLDLRAALALNLLGAMVPLVLLASRLRRFRPDVRPSLATLRQALPYAWRTATTGLATSVTNRIDQVVLVAAVPSRKLGLYAVAAVASSVTSPLASGLSVALFGHLRGETSTIRAQARFRRAVAMTLILSSSVALVLAVLAPLLLRLVYGRQFEGATTSLRILLPGAVALDVLGIITSKLLSEGRPGEASRAALLGAGLTAVGLVVLIPRFGIEGAATVTTIAFSAEVAYLVRRGALRTAARSDDPLAEARPSPVTPFPSI